eukprot:TRINITY_DN13632_c0_g1_i2.p1 TRINITY_DN13632_c0_g1~~TRINITY_DN13632_c0_g1_i2.p1  ORF type:complete len:113 (+),score=15.23 TRINITY_DN13632_c0_g1_i2:77-415(+)
MDCLLVSFCCLKRKDYLALPLNNTCLKRKDYLALPLNNTCLKRKDYLALPLNNTCLSCKHQNKWPVFEAGWKDVGSANAVLSFFLGRERELGCKALYSSHLTLSCSVGHHFQ